MAKPRVIIADEDVNYIIPLQFKFVTDFFDKIELEIISEKNYFEEFFSRPQNAAILIVSDELYNSSIQRHNISNVFVMMEQLEDGDTGELNVNRLFKYTSIKEIFNEIIGKSAGALNVVDIEKKETQIILVTSATGGVGKTTIAIGMAACLAKNYKRVLYINASRLQNFQYLMDNKSPLSSSDVYSKLLNPTDKIYDDIKHVVRMETFSYIPTFKSSLLSLGIDYDIYKKVAVSAKNSAEYDYIVIDADSTFDEKQTNLIDISDRVIIVTEQSLNSIFATNMLVSNISDMYIDKFIFVCNKFKKDGYNALILPEVESKFSVSEYVDFSDVDEYKRLNNCIERKGIQRVSFLVI